MAELRNDDSKGIPYIKNSGKSSFTSKELCLYFGDPADAYLQHQAFLEETIDEIKREKYGDLYHLVMKPKRSNNPYSRVRYEDEYHEAVHNGFSVDSSVVFFEIFNRLTPGLKELFRDEYGDCCTLSSLNHFIVTYGLEIDYEVPGTSSEVRNDTENPFLVYGSTTKKSP